MRFQLVDRILEVVPGQRLTAVKNLTLGEEYLADHFPSFPVMPGVLMLEALVQSAAWLWRVTDDFAHSVIVLREVKSIKYANFVQPAGQLTLSVEIDKNTQNGMMSRFRGTGEVAGTQTVSARFVLEAYNLRDRKAGTEPLDRHLTEQYRLQYQTLGPSA